MNGDFEGWDFGDNSTEGSSSDVASGVLSLSVPGGTFGSANLTYSGGTYEDFIFETRFKLNEPEESSRDGISIILRGVPATDGGWDGGYNFTLEQLGSSLRSANCFYSRLTEYLEGTDQVNVLDYGYACFAAYDEHHYWYGGYNTIKIIAQDSKIFVYVNNYRVRDVNADEFSGVINLKIYQSGNEEPKTGGIDWARASVIE